MSKQSETLREKILAILQDGLTFEGVTDQLLSLISDQVREGKVEELKVLREEFEYEKFTIEDYAFDIGDGTVIREKSATVIQYEGVNEVIDMRIAALTSTSDKEKESDERE